MCASMTKHFLSSSEVIHGWVAVPSRRHSVCPRNLVLYIYLLCLFRSIHIFVMSILIHNFYPTKCTFNRREKFYFYRGEPRYISS